VFIWMLHMFHTYVASVLSGCCVCFYNDFKCFSGVFVSVSDTCFKCFIYLQTYVASVASECFNSRSGVASPSSPSAASPRCLLLLSAPAGHPSLLPLFSMLVTFGVAWAPYGRVKRREKRGRPGASKTLYQIASDTQLSMFHY
jgi:hypothetical protein